MRSATISTQCEMGYYAIAFFVIAIACGIYALSDLTAGALLIGTLLFSDFLIMAAGCVIFYFDSRREK